MQVPIACNVPLRASEEIVCAAVNLYIEPYFQAAEIERHAAERMLLAKLVAAGTLAKLGPQQAFRGRHLAPQLPSHANRCIWSAEGPMLAPRLLLPGTGRGTTRVSEWWRGRGVRYPRLDRSTTRLCPAVPLPVLGRILLVPPHHIRNTPKRGVSGIGAFSVAANARPRTSRVWAGSITPSSHRRAVAWYGLPSSS